MHYFNNLSIELLNFYSNFYLIRCNRFIDFLYLDYNFILLQDNDLNNIELSNIYKFIIYKDNLDFFINKNTILNGIYTLDLYLFIPEIFIFFSLIFIFTILTLFPFKNKIKINYYFSLFLFLLSIILFLNNISYNFDIFFSTFFFNDYIFFIKVFILILTLFFLPLILNYLKFEFIKSFEYIFIFNLVIFSLILLIGVNDFISFFLCLELQSLGLYLLAAYKTNSTFSTEAGMKYFILGAIATGLILFGISLVYGITGSTNFTDIVKFNFDNSLLNLMFVPSPFIYFNIDDNNSLFIFIFDLLNFYIFPAFYISIFSIFFIALLFILIGLFFKLGIVPFHMWLPDVYEGSMTISTAFFSTIPKISLLFFFFRFLNLHYTQIGDWSTIFIISAIFSIFIGTFGAMLQFKIKRLIAYSAIGHIGFILLGLTSFNYLNYIASSFYSILYIFLNFCFFSILITLRKINFIEIKTIFDLNCMVKHNKVLSIFLALNLFSIAGIPPLMGFFSKMFILNTLIFNEMFFITFIILLLSVISVFYYIRLIKILFFSLNSNFIFLKNPSKIISFIIVFFSLLNLLFFFLPNIFFIEISRIIFLF